VRTAFIEQLIHEARGNPKIFLVVGDLGYSVIEPFAEEFPDRFLNAGVAEQNMTGLAAGLASEGYHVFTYSIGNFPTLRCLEQIRNDICYHQLPVTVVAVGAGMAYGNLGYSHHCIQDIAALRGFPSMTILSPADPGETKACVKWLSDHPRPSYLRLGKAGEPTIHSLSTELNGPLKIVNNQANVAIIGTGSILAEAVIASNLLATQDIRVDVLSLTRLSPTSDQNFSSLQNYKKILTVEEHVEAGGLGELIRSAAPGNNSIRSLNVPEFICSTVGSQSWLRAQAKIDSKGISETLLAWIRHD
jgi:transketolase